MVRFCHAYATAFPGRARCFAFGRTPEGRDLGALAASDDGAQFFYRLHPAHDLGVERYPVLRVDEVPHR